MSSYSLRNTLTFRSDYDFRTVFKQLILCAYKDMRIIYSHDKRKLSNGQL